MRNRSIRQVYAVWLLTVLLFSAAACSNKDQQQPGITTRESEHNHVFDSLVVLAQAQLAENPDEVRNIVELAGQYYDPADRQRRMQLYNLTGISYFIQSSYEKALENYTQGMLLALEIEDNDRIASFYNNIGIINLHTGQYTDALEHFLKALEYYEKIGDEHRKVNTLNNLGMLYSNIDNFELAHIQLDKAFKGFLATNDSIGLAAVNNNRGALFLKKQEPDSALIYLDKAIDIAHRTNNRFGLSGSYIEKAKVFCFLGDRKQALQYYQKSEQVSSEINYQEKVCEAKIGMAQAFLELNNEQKALDHAREGMEIAQALANNKLMMEIHLLLSEIFEQRRDFQQSLFHKNHYIYLKEEIIDQSKLHQLYTLEIQGLSHAKEIQMLEIQRQELLLSRKNSTIFLISLAFVMIIGGLYLLYHNHKYRQLASHQKMILDLTEKKSRAAVEAEIQERNRIGRELHDGLGQMLSVARLNISVLQQKAMLTEERRKELQEAAMQSVDKAFSELRNISHNLAPSVLAEKGFSGALQDLTDQLNKSCRINVHLETFDLDQPMDALIENALFRAIQELINNVIKHADA
ncbi:MAG: tetratricopeptide repeat-containing sensor histidine kinase, partial [Bacteroidota bacterium]